MAIGSSRVSWLQEPCVFVHRSQADGGNSCESCNEQFTFFWSGRRNCDYCGSIVHNKCTVSLKHGAGSNKQRTKMCFTCCKYRDHYSPVLRLGDEFICYNNRLPAASYLYLSEEKHSLLITIDPSDQLIEIPLADIKRVQKGFSHSGHVNASNHYDPLRCLSIHVSHTRSHTTTDNTYNLKTHSPISCQLWVNGLNAALAVYDRIVEQESALYQLRLKNGGLLPSNAHHQYFPDANSTTSSGSTSTQPEAMDQSEDSMVIISSTDVSVANHAPDLVVIDVDDSSRGSTPFDHTDEVTTSTPSPSQSNLSPVVRKSHYKIRTVASPYTMVVPRKSPQPSWDTLSNTSQVSGDWRTKTTDSSVSTASSGLPYKGRKNPLASYCNCHAYAIDPSSAILVSQNPLLNESGSRKEEDPFKSCCHRCRDKCRLIKDLSLF